MAFDSTEQAWCDMELFIDGQRMATIQSIKYGHKSSDELLYGQGKRPIGIQSGNEDFSGSVGLLKSEADDLREGALLKDIRACCKCVT